MAYWMWLSLTVSIAALAVEFVAGTHSLDELPDNSPPPSSSSIDIPIPSSEAKSFQHELLALFSRICQDMDSAYWVLSAKFPMGGLSHRKYFYAQPEVAKDDEKDTLDKSKTRSETSTESQIDFFDHPSRVTYVQPPDIPGLPRWFYAAMDRYIFMFPQSVQDHASAVFEILTDKLTKYQNELIGVRVPLVYSPIENDVALDTSNYENVLYLHCEVTSSLDPDLVERMDFAAHNILGSVHPHVLGFVRVTVRRMFWLACELLNRVLKPWEMPVRNKPVNVVNSNEPDELHHVAESFGPFGAATYYRRPSISDNTYSRRPSISDDTYSRRPSISYDIFIKANPPQSYGLPYDFLVRTGLFASMFPKSERKGAMAMINTMVSELKTFTETWKNYGLLLQFDPKKSVQSADIKERDIFHLWKDDPLPPNQAKALLQLQTAAKKLVFSVRADLVRIVEKHISEIFFKFWTLKYKHHQNVAKRVVLRFLISHGLSPRRSSRLLRWSYPISK